MDNMSISDNSIINCLNKNFQTNAYLVKDNENQYLDNEIMNKEILQNPNLEHKNFIKSIDFGINRNTCGPYAFGVEFNAKFFMNIIREYYLKLNCLRLNLIVNNRIIYIYGHYNQILKIYTKINTHYMHPDMVKIIEGHNKELRANFDVQTLLKTLELHNFSNKEIMKMYFVLEQNYKQKSKKNKNISSVNPFLELQGQQSRFDSDFNFDENAIPGNIIIETTYKCNIECNFAPLEFCSPPQIPNAIFTDYILSISIDKLCSSTQKMNPLSPLEIFCNHYICNFISNENSENFLTYDNSEGIQFKRENALKFCKNYDPSVDESNLYQKMINFTLKKYELEALKMINKKTSVIYFYVRKKEKYYFTQETDQEGNVTTAIILHQEENKPLIKDIEDCFFYQDHWNEWLNYLGNILPKDCIIELEKMRKLKEAQFNNNNGNDNVEIDASTHNKKNKKKIKKEKSSINSLNNENEKNKENIKSEHSGLALYGSDKNGNLKKFPINENIFDIDVSDIGRDDKNDIVAKRNDGENVINPFFIK